MKISLLTAFVCLGAAFPRVRQIENLNNSDRIPGEFLVVLNASSGKVSNVEYAKSVEEKIASISEKISILESYTNLKHPILYVKTSDENVMTQLFHLDEVNIITSNLHQQMMIQCDTRQYSTHYLWNLNRIAYRDSILLHSGLSYPYNPIAGSGIRAYILDTGIRLTHEDFINRGEFGWNFVGGSNDDANGHGTHCAGTVAGTEHGVSKAATVVAVKVIHDDGSGITSEIIAGINWSIGDVQSKGVRGVINLSISGAPDLALDSAVTDADALGIPVVVPAGNNDANACEYSPGRAMGAITVASINMINVLAPTSNWGRCVKMLAPGENVWSAFILNDMSFTVMSGTSMAASHVSGLIANHFTFFPEATTAAVKVFLANSATRGIADLRNSTMFELTQNQILFSICI